MGKVAESKFIGGRIPSEIHDEIIKRCKARKISKSVYAESIFKFWEKLGKPDLEQMDILAIHFEQTGKLDILDYIEDTENDGPTPPGVYEDKFLSMVKTAFKRIEALEEQAAQYNKKP